MDDDKIFEIRAMNLKFCDTLTAREYSQNYAEEGIRDVFMYHKNLTHSNPISIITYQDACRFCDNWHLHFCRNKMT